MGRFLNTTPGVDKLCYWHNDGQHFVIENPGELAERFRLYTGGQSSTSDAFPRQMRVSSSEGRKGILRNLFRRYGFMIWLQPYLLEDPFSDVLYFCTRRMAGGGCGARLSSRRD